MKPSNKQHAGYPSVDTLTDEQHEALMNAWEGMEELLIEIDRDLRLNVALGLLFRAMTEADVSPKEVYDRILGWEFGTLWATS